jgi:diacylglycerol kinase family enzyme
MTETQFDGTAGRTIAVVYNPAAGGGKAKRRKWLIETALKAYEIPYDLFVTESESHLVETADSVIERYPVIIGAGGDTTVNLIATRILDRGTKNALGVFGMGSVNDLARELGLFRLKDSLEALKNGMVCDMDVGVLRSDSRPEPFYFLVSASLGLGVAINRYVEDWMRKHRLLSSFRASSGIPAAMSAIQQAFKNKDVPLRVTVEAGGRAEDIVSSLLVFGNISSLAGLFRPSPTASPVSGSLDCCVFEVTSLANALQVAFDIKRKKHLEKKQVRIIRDTVFRVSSESPLEFQVDGAIFDMGREVEISLLPKALRMYTAKSCFLAE